MFLKQIIIAITFLFIHNLGFSQYHVNYAFPDSSRTVENVCVLTDIPSHITICENTSAEIEINTDEGDIYWYGDEEIPPGVLKKSFVFETGILSSSQRYYVQKLCPYRRSQFNSLETRWGGDNGKEGVMFSVFAKSEIRLQSIDIHAKSGLANCHVYMIEGSYDMQMNNPGAWTPVYDGLIECKGKGVPVTIDIEDLVLGEGMTYGFYISLENDDILYYSTGSGEFENAELILGNGKGVSWPFGQACGMREFNGQLNYVVGDRDRSIKYPVDIKVIPKPRAPAVYFNGTAFETYGNDGFVWYRDGKVLDNETGPLCFPVETGSYSVAAYTGQCLSEPSDGLYYAESDIKPDNLSVFPNPVDDLLNIDLSETGISNAEIIISDAGGSLKRIGSVSGNTVQVDLNGLRPGRYMLTVKAGTRVVSKQILKR